MNDTHYACTCRCHNKAPHGYHQGDCPMKDHPDSVRERLKLLQAEQASQRNWARACEVRAQLWEGKFRIVKHENNQLRQKLYQKKEPKP